MSGGPLRFEVRAALLIGLLLPILETMRRGASYWSVNATTMLEDYAGGALLLASWLAAINAKPYATRLLLMSWAGVTAMMSISFADQVETTLRGVDLEPNNGVVLVFKLLLWSTCLLALHRSFRAAARLPREE